MKIYILEDPDYDGVNIEGVFSTREKAVAALPYYQYLTEKHIQEHEVDPVLSGEMYADYFYCNVMPSAEKEKVWGDSTRMKPSEFIPFKFIEHHVGATDHTMGYGKTPEESEANARHAQTLLDPIWQVWQKDKYGDYYAKHLPHPSMIYKESFRHGAYAVHRDYNVAKIDVMEYEKTGKIGQFLTVPPKI